MQANRKNQKPRSNFGRALRWARHFRGLPQEQFDLVSSRTYISALERGLKAPTLGKIDSLAEVLHMHPLSLAALSYVEEPDIEAVDALLRSVREELRVAIEQRSGEARDDAPRR